MWTALTNLTQIHVITIRNWIKYQTICIYFETFRKLQLTNIVMVGDQIRCFWRKKEVWHSKVHIRTSCHYKKTYPFRPSVITCPLQLMARKCINKFIWLPTGGFWLRIWENWQPKASDWQPKWLIYTFCHERTSYLLVCTLVPGAHKTTWPAEKCHRNMFWKGGMA